MSFGKKVVITQSNYIPWKGYFDAIGLSDEFILFDDAQFTRRDWRNRNKIKTGNGIQWLTIPVEVKGKYFQKINETRVSEKNWAEKHWKTIKLSYSKAACYNECKDFFEDLYLNTPHSDLLSEINFIFLSKISALLGLNTSFRFSSEFIKEEDRTERLVSICKQTNASHYFSGPSAKNYLDENLFLKEGIGLSYLDYTGYPEYTQLYGEFVHELSILDLIFNEGKNAINFMKCRK